MQLGITPTKATGVGLTTNLSYHTDAMVYNNVGPKAIGTGGFGPLAGYENNHQLRSKLYRR